MDFAPGDPPYWDAVLAFDDQALERSLTRRAGSSGAGDLASAWLGLMRGQAQSLEAGMGQLFSDASVTRDARRVIEATALRAMVAASVGKLADAVAFARRASLMARTEALPEAELLANLVLARMRRHTGKPHLAVRISEAVARLAPTRSAGWLDWERLLAGGIDPNRPPADGPSPAAVAVRSAQRLLLAAREGLREGFEREVAELERATAGFSDMHDEARMLVALLDPERPAPEGLLPFKRGDNEELRYGLFGAGVLASEEEPAVRVFVVARPGERGGRILRDGLALFGACRMLSWDEGARRTHGRTDAGISVLALSGQEVMPQEEFFRRVYGFPYSRAAHRGVLDVLLYRMRERVGPSGIVVRTDGSLRLDLAEAIAVADPRCSPPAAARVLSALSRQPLATADTIAGRLGITVRSAQMALQQLVADGACAMRRKGRHMEYQLQDSAFSEPTGSDVLLPST